MKRADFFKLWVEALRSRKFKQTQGTLVNDNRFCCLGVACEIANRNEIKKFDFADMELLPDIMTKFLGIDSEGNFKESIKYGGKYYESLVELNDLQVPFGRIATIIEKQLAARNFRKP